jgi:hypothetical protein
MIRTRRMRWVGCVVLITVARNSYILVAKSEGKKGLRRALCKWEVIIKMDLKEMGWVSWDGVMWLRMGTGGGLL